MLRVGYGIFFDTIGVNKTDSIQTGFSQSTPIQASLDSGLTYVATTANPFPTGLIAPAGASGGLTTNLGQAVSFFPERPRPAVRAALVLRHSAGSCRDSSSPRLLTWAAAARGFWSRGSLITRPRNI